ncbi:MAG: prepilin-type N-terminal cleavage/methylation domain-containing protein [Alphaproteobacteria bacterium]
MKNTKTQAFTLIELSIVIIIIGIIIGGILAGNELLKQAKIRGLLNDIQNIQTSINAFKLKFDALPGDFRNAGKIWTSTTCTDASTNAGCNGNSDYVITGGGGVDGQEIYRFWQHLSLGGFINGTYTGTSAMTDQYKLSYSSNLYVNIRNVPAFVGGLSNNYLEIGAWNSTLGLASDGAINQIDAYQMDIKTDDSLANSGRFLGIDGYTALGIYCSYSYLSVGGEADYKLTGTRGPACRLKVPID